MRDMKSLQEAHTSSAEPLLSRRYVELAVQSYEDGDLTEGQLMKILHTDRQRARQIVEEVKSQTAVVLEGNAERFDLTETLLGSGKTDPTGTSSPGED